MILFPFTDNLNKYVLEVADIAFDLLLTTLPQPYQSEIKVYRPNFMITLPTQIV